nr:hypothetical protein [Tanacetum cinerariifolium]
MSTPAEFRILSSGDNRPPMLKKHLTKKYEELSATEKNQADCDLKETNIILQRLPFDGYSLVNHHKVAKDLWERVQLLMQEQFQVNTKFLNSLPLEWNKFMTNVKLVRDLHTTNFDQLHAYLEKYEIHANEVRIMREHNQDPLALVVNNQRHNHTSTLINPHTTILSSNNSFHHLIHQDACSQPQSIPQIEYTISTVNQQTHLAEFPQIDSSLAGRQSSFAASTSGTRANISGTGGNNSGQQRVVKCFTYQREGHMARQCPKPKRKRDATWFRDKVLLVKAQGYGKVLNEEELEFLADPGVAKVPVTQTIITYNAAYQADDLNAYDSDCDDFSIAKAVLMDNLSSYRSDVLSEAPHSKNTHTDMLNQSINTSVYVKSSVILNDSVNYVEMCNKYLELEDELIKQHNMVEKDEYNKLSKWFYELE